MLGNNFCQDHMCYGLGSLVWDRVEFRLTRIYVDKSEQVFIFRVGGGNDPQVSMASF